MVQCRAVLVLGAYSYKCCSLNTSPCTELLNRYKDILFVTAVVNKRWLFPKMHCIVHDCAVSAMGEVLRSGTPSIPCPSSSHGHKLAKILVGHGIAPCDIPFAQLTQVKLSDALKIVLDPISRVNFYENSKLIATFVKQESKDSLMKYCDIITSADAGKQWKKSPPVCVSRNFHTVLKARRRTNKLGRFKLKYTMSNTDEVRVDSTCMPLIQSNGYIKIDCRKDDNFNYVLQY